MPKASADPVQKRLHILSPSEVEALFARPVFTPDERIQAFTLTPAEKSMLFMFSRLHIQVAFILELGYFKAKQRFFSISFAAVTDDLQAILAQHFPTATLAKLRPITKPTRIKIRRAILHLQQHHLCGSTERIALALRARQAAQISSKPIYVFREVFRYLSEQRWVAPGYTVLQDLVSQTITDEYERLTAIFQQHLTPADCAVFDELFAETEGLYPLTRLKHDPRDFSRSEMRQERARADQLRPLYAIAQRVLPHLGISAEGMKYYAALVSYYTVFRLRQFDDWTIYLYLVCFVVDRYHRLHDHLLTCLITTVKHVVDTAKEAAKEQVYLHRLARNADLPKAGRILKLFTTNHPPDLLASTIQDHAFAILERSRIEQVAEYLTTNARFDEVAFQWDHIQTLSQRFKPPLRPILRLVEFASLRLHDPVLEAVCFLKQVWDQNRRLSQVNPDAIPMRFIPKHLRRYLYQVTTDGTKQIIPDRYEFLLYRLLRNGLESGDLFCRTSNRFQSFEDDLIDATVWQEQKAALLQETGVAFFLQPITEHLAALEQELEAQIVAVNTRITTGENPHLHVKAKARRKRPNWTLHYPKGSEAINHPLFDSLRQVNIGNVLDFANHHCHVAQSFDHIINRHTKHAVDAQALHACLIAWGTNMGLGRMGEISDLSYQTLATTSDNFIRLETLKAANDRVCNAIATLPIFRHYDLDDVVHSSSDGQKFETRRPTINARHSPKYFGLKKGVVSYSLVANHIPVNAKIIGAHEHESHFVFDLLFNNSTEIQPDIHSTDTHGTNQVNFALLHLFGYQFAPRYEDLPGRVKTGLYGFQHPNQYGDLVIKPIRKLNTALIIDEWDNLLRIFVSLARKTTTQSIIVGKLNAYARRNKTRRALWEYDNILSSLYMLRYIDMPALRQNVQRALNRGENYHQLRRAIAYANFGKLRFKSEAEQQVWGECSRLLTNCLIYYNTTILSRLLEQKQSIGDHTGVALITRIAPVAWQHINFYGRYEFTQTAVPINLDAIVTMLAQHPIPAMSDA